MNQPNEQLFPSEFILNYIQEDSQRERFVIYAAFRFLTLAGKEDTTLPSILKKRLSCTFTPADFSVVEDYLSEDYYFSPSLALDTFEPLYLYTAIFLVRKAPADERAILGELIGTYAPVSAGLSYRTSAPNLAALLPSGLNFYAALYLAARDLEAALADILPLFARIYRSEYRFTREDFILFDFMDEYFEQRNCMQHPAFIELVDTLVAATLNYYDTDFGTLLEGEVSFNLAGTAARFSGVKRFGSVALPALPSTDQSCRMLAELFRYAALYELRNNLFDFHLDDDKLITLENWKEKLRWHYVQYANVYTLALDSFHTATLSSALLRRQFAVCIETI